MLVLVPKPLRSLGSNASHPNIGQLVQPRSWWTPDGTVPWAADNDAFNTFDPGRFRSLLERVAGIPNCLWVAAPDVVGDFRATLNLFYEWREEIVSRRLPVAFVLQDGATPAQVPWGFVSAVFVGGSTIWKMSSEARACVDVAHDEQVAVHMGRVNTRRRIRLAKSWTVDSIDGTASARFTRSVLPWMLDHAAAPPQGVFDHE